MWCMKPNLIHFGAFHEVHRATQFYMLTEPPNPHIAYYMQWSHPLTSTKIGAYLWKAPLDVSCTILYYNILHNHNDSMFVTKDMQYVSFQVNCQCGSSMAARHLTGGWRSCTTPCGAASAPHNLVTRRPRSSVLTSAMSE